MAWSSLFSIIISTVLLWNLLGVASLAGICVMVVLIPFNSYVTNKSKQLQIKKLDYQDSRVKTLNELLSGIKVIDIIYQNLNK